MAGRPLRKLRKREGTYVEKKISWTPPPKAQFVAARPRAAPVVAEKVEDEGLTMLARDSDVFKADTVLAGENHSIFEELLGLSLRRSRDIMLMTLDPDDRNFPKLLASQESIAKSVFTVTARINDTELRRKQNDKIGGLLEEIKQAQADQSRLPGEHPLDEESALRAALLN